MPTTAMGWAYLSGTDHPLEFPPVTQTNANKLETAKLDTVQSALTQFGGFVLTAGSQCTRRNGWAIMKGVVTSATAPAAGAQIGWLPASGFTPAQEWYGHATGNPASGGGLKTYLISVDSGNKILIRGSAMPVANEPLTLAMVYPL